MPRQHEHCTLRGAVVCKGLRGAALLESQKEGKTVVAVPMSASGGKHEEGNWGSSPARGVAQTALEARTPGLETPLAGHFELD